MAMGTSAAGSAASIPMAARPAGVTTRSVAGPVGTFRPALERSLGNEASDDQRPERSLERRALQSDRRGRGQDTEVAARSRGGRQTAWVSESLGMISVPC